LAFKIISIRIKVETVKLHYPSVIKKLMIFFPDVDPSWFQNQFSKQIENLHFKREKLATFMYFCKLKRK